MLWENNQMWESVHIGYMFLATLEHIFLLCEDYFCLTPSNGQTILKSTNPELI